MISNDFQIDFERKTISFVGKNKTIYHANELYSYIMDLSDEPENMKYEIPIVAKSQTEFELINGWTIDKAGLTKISGNLSVSNI